MQASNQTSELTSQEWHSLSEQEIANLLESSEESGLNSDLVNERLKEFGPNELTGKKSPTFMVKISPPI